MKSNKKTLPKIKLRKQISLSIIAVVFGMIVLVFILNSTLLGRVYLKEKEKKMLSAYDTLNKASEKGTLYDNDFHVTFEKLCANDSVSILVVSSDGSVALSSSGSKEDYFMVQQLLKMVLRGSVEEDQDDKVLISEDDYVMEEQKDERMDGDFLVLWGTLDDGNMIMMRCAIESMRDSVKVTNQFLLIVGILMALLCALISRFLAKRISQPILELTDISKKMAALDFEAKYDARPNGNEIDILGHHMNELSETLENTIKELKQANVDLQKDIELRDKNENMRKEFLSNVSHELKTPIALIQGYAEGLVDGISDDPEDEKYYCNVIIDEAKRMNRMVREMLALNQLEYGQNTVEMERMDIVEVIQGVIHQTSLLAEQNEVSIQFQDSRQIFVWADEFFLEQVISNYLTNAIHYAKNEKVVSVSVETFEKEVKISVFNTGDTIPEENLPYLWEKFYKVDKARTREYGGSGIGLSVVKAVMDSFHKACGVENRANGVLFWFTLDR